MRSGKSSGALVVTEPVVDVFIPVHGQHRPIARAVSSVLEGSTADIRVTVVCHNIASDAMATCARQLGDRPASAPLGASRTASRARRGRSTPATPPPTAEFTALLDSDDR